MGIVEGIVTIVLGIIAGGVALAIGATIVGLTLLGVIIWGGMSIAKRISGKSDRQKNLPTGGSARAGIPAAQMPVSQAPSTMRDYEYLDIDDGVTADTVMDAMRPYDGAPYVGEYARSVISTLGKAEFTQKGLIAAMDREFTRDTITWDKFAAPVDVAMEGILRNCIQIANRVQAFDTAEYARLSRLVKAGAASPESSNYQRWELFGNTLKEMDGLRQGNEQLLFELEKLQDELTKLDDGGSSDTSDIAEEIRKLSEEAKYYT